MSTFLQIVGIAACFGFGIFGVVKIVHFLEKMERSQGMLDEHERSLDRTADRLDSIEINHQNRLIDIGLQIKNLEEEWKKIDNALEQQFYVNAKHFKDLEELRHKVDILWENVSKLNERTMVKYNECSNQIPEEKVPSLDEMLKQSYDVPYKTTLCDKEG